MDEGGLAFGERFVFANGATGDLFSTDADRARLFALLSVAYREPVRLRAMLHIEAAAGHWRRGYRALANIHLAYNGLRRLDDPTTDGRLRLAEWLLGHGLTPRALMAALDLAPPPSLERRYNPNQPRVPAGNGDESGRWVAVWHGIRDWLAEPVPEYDTDTGEVVGTRSRGQAIATNPITLGIAGAAALFGGGVVAGEAAVGEAAISVGEILEGGGTAAALDTAPAAEAEIVSLFTRRYLSTTGGRLGGAATRRQLYEIAKEYKDSGKFADFRGDGLDKEEYISDIGSGGTYVDFTATEPNGTSVRIQTIDTLVDGVTPTAREAAAATRIRLAKPDDILKLIPKRLQ